MHGPLPLCAATSPHPLGIARGWHPSLAVSCPPCHTRLLSQKIAGGAARHPCSGQSPSPCADAAPMGAPRGRTRAHEETFLGSLVGACTCECVPAWCACVCLCVCVSRASHDKSGENREGRVAARWGSLRAGHDSRRAADVGPGCARRSVRRARGGRGAAMRTRRRASTRAHRPPRRHPRRCPRVRRHSRRSCLTGRLRRNSRRRRHLACRAQS